MVEYAPGLVAALFGALGVLLRWRKGLFLTPAAGWHGTIFLMYGVGGMAFLAEPVEGRVPVAFLLPAFDVVMRYIAYGQVLAFGLDYLFLRKMARPELPSRSDRTFRIAVLVSVMALTGYIGVQAGLAQSGAGTVFAVLAVFRYPSTIFLVLSARSPSQRLVAGAFTLISFAFAFASPWRSELIFLTAAILLALGLRGNRRVVPLTAVGLLVFLYLLPFLNAKKVRLDEFTEAPVDFFLESERVALPDRFTEFVRFLAIRMDQGRDLAHLVVALDSGQVVPVGSEYYGTIAAQLVPRLLWPEKPSYNTRTGFDLPREIGLVAPGDAGTSWGVGLLGELVYVHGTWVLALAVPLVTLFLICFEWFAKRIRWRVPEFRHVVGACFLFMFISPGSPVMLSTYVVWVFIFAYLADWIVATTHTVQTVAGPAPSMVAPAQRPTPSSGSTARSQEALARPGRPRPVNADHQPPRR